MWSFLDVKQNDKINSRGGGKSNIPVPGCPVTRAPFSQPGTPLAKISCLGERLEKLLVTAADKHIVPHCLYWKLEICDLPCDDFGIAVLRPEIVESSPLTVASDALEAIIQGIPGIDISSLRSCSSSA